MYTYSGYNSLRLLLLSNIYKYLWQGSSKDFWNTRSDIVRATILFSGTNLLIAFLYWDKIPYTHNLNEKKLIWTQFAVGSVHTAGSIAE